MPTTVNFQITRGLPWKRYIVVKSKLTRYRVNVTSPNAFIQVSPTHKKEIATQITPEGTIRLYLNADETVDLPEGQLSYDVWANVRVGLNEDVYKPVASGVLEVKSYNNITPLEDTDAMEIRYKQRTDYRRTFTWKDTNGTVIAVTDAFMQAKDSNNNTVLDLRWYSPAPSEATVIGLTPANKRGYLAPASGGTLEMHISDKNDIAVGTYRFDLFVKDSAGDWDCLVQGALVVEAAVSAPPA